MPGLHLDSFRSSPRVAARKLHRIRCTEVARLLNHLSPLHGEPLLRGHAALSRHQKTLGKLMISRKLKQPFPAKRPRVFSGQLI